MFTHQRVDLLRLYTRRLGALLRILEGSTGESELVRGMVAATTSSMAEDFDRWATPETQTDTMRRTRYAQVGLTDTEIDAVHELAANGHEIPDLGAAIRSRFALLSDAPDDDLHTAIPAVPSVVFGEDACPACNFMMTSNFMATSNTATSNSPPTPSGDRGWDRYFERLDMPDTEVHYRGVDAVERLLAEHPGVVGQLGIDGIDVDSASLVVSNNCANVTVRGVAVVEKGVPAYSPTETDDIGRMMRTPGAHETDVFFTAV